MPELVEGYTQGSENDNPPSDAANWVGPLRREARQALVRRLVLHRIENGGLEWFPAQKKYEWDWCKILEAFAIGTAVAVTSHFVLKWLGGKK